MLRSLTARFVAPIVVLLLGLFGGWFFYEPGWGIAVGTLLAVLMATFLASRLSGRLRDMRAVASGSGGAMDLNSFGPDDTVGETLRAVTEATTELRRQQEAVESLLVQQAQVLDRMNDGLMRVDEDSTIVYANVAAGTLFGGRNPAGRSFVGVTRDHELATALQRCIDTGEEQEHTFEIAGEGRLLSAVLTRIAEQPAEALVMLRDITEVNRLQTLRRDFVANVSHELRTPLSTIKILTETLIDLRDEDAEAVGYLEKIDHEVDSMTALVRDLLDLTRLETQAGRLTTRGIDACQLVEDVCERMRPLAERNHVRLEAAAGDDPAMFVGDERRLHQALVNLVTNAINHTPAGGTVSIEAEAEARWIRLRVRDTGSGIAEDDLPRVWERFFKTDKARSAPGTGLGLAIVKHIVQAHGGTVGAASELGKGSVFTIAIPRVMPPETTIGDRLPAAADIFIPD